MRHSQSIEAFGEQWKNLLHSKAKAQVICTPLRVYEEPPKTDQPKLGATKKAATMGER
jgi:hypothetical protein